MTELLVVAAGKGSRMGEIMVPKTLASVNGAPNLENTLTVIGSLFSKITIAVTHSMLHHFATFIKERGYKNVALLPIPSGLGSGHAVMMALKNMLPNLRAKNSPPMIMTWGDVHFANSQLVQELLNEEKVYEHTRKKPAMVIPCAWESEPYISISADDELSASGITFDDKRRGLHDQSVFLLSNPVEVYRRLHQMHCAIWNQGAYITAIKEFGFLQVVSYMANIGEPAKVYITENCVKSYNSMAELREIEDSLTTAKLQVFCENRIIL